MNDLKNIDSEILEEKINADASSTSMRELLERKQKKITWKGSKEDLIYFFDQLFNRIGIAIAGDFQQSKDWLGTMPITTKRDFGALHR